MVSLALLFEVVSGNTELPRRCQLIKVFAIAPSGTENVQFSAATLGRNPRYVWGLTYPNVVTYPQYISLLMFLS
jgi:hypothetical protein